MSSIITCFSKHARVATVFLVALSTLIWCNTGVFDSYNDRGFKALYRLKWAEAERLFNAGLDQAERSGPDSPAVAISLVNLALVYSRQCRYSEAEPLLERALSINDRIPNPDRLELATNLNNLGMVYYNGGLYEKAEPLLKRALTTGEIARGPDRSRWIFTDNLANLYRDTAAWDAAERLYRRELEMYEQTPGTNLQYRASVLNEIGSVCYKQGKLAEAEALYRRALVLNEQAWERDLATEKQILGPHHRRVVTPGSGSLYMAPNLINLAELYSMQGRYDEAEPVARRALKIEEKECGLESEQAKYVYTEILRKRDPDLLALEIEQRFKTIKAGSCTLNEFSRQRPTAELRNRMITFNNSRWAKAYQSQIFAETARKVKQHEEHLHSFGCCDYFCHPHGADGRGSGRQ